MIKAAAGRPNKGVRQPAITPLTSMWYWFPIKANPDPSSSMVFAIFCTQICTQKDMKSCVQRRKMLETYARPKR
jgi:hypothetical protein